MSMSNRIPTEEEVLGYFHSLSNWGRWGDDDQRGTLNHISETTRRRAVGAVHHGRSVSLAWELDTQPGGFDRDTHAFGNASTLGAPEHEHARWGSAGEHLCLTFHGVTQTHLDSLAHIFWDGQMFNGRNWERVNADEGATWGAVTAAGSGMLTRGILLDVAALRDEQWLEGPVFPQDLEAAEERQGVQVEPGDAVLLRTGFGAKRVVQSMTNDERMVMNRPGWHASCLPWLHERDVAYIGADTPNDVMPSGYPGVFFPIHAIGITAMGLWLIDNCDLEACASTAAELEQWSFLLAVCPLRLAGVTGSPVNPIAMF
jgi:kynurenine formamidase